MIQFHLQIGILNGVKALLGDNLISFLKVCRDRGKLIEYIRRLRNFNERLEYFFNIAVAN